MNIPALVGRLSLVAGGWLFRIKYLSVIIIISVIEMAQPTIASHSPHPSIYSCSARHNTGRHSSTEAAVLIVCACGIVSWLLFAYTASPGKDPELFEMTESDVWFLLTDRNCKVWYTSRPHFLLNPVPGWVNGVRVVMVLVVVVYGGSTWTMN